MRLSNEIQTFIKEMSINLFPATDVFLFGSRVDDKLKGGDIDLLLISNDKLASSSIRRFRIEFFKKFGWQKIDLVNFTKDQDSVFKNIALSNSIKLV